MVRKENENIMTQAAGFREERTRRRIDELIRQINMEDKNWKWKVPVVKENEVWMWWEYLEYMGEDQCKAYFRLVYDKATGWFAVYDEHDGDITDQLEYYDNLKDTMRSVFYYAMNRY